MKYQKIIDLLDNASNQPTNFRTKSWIETNDHARGTYNNTSQIKFQSTLLKSRLSDYSDLYILVKGTLIVSKTTTAAKANSQRGYNGANNSEMVVSLKYLCNFWKTPETALISCEINLSLNWSAHCVIKSSAVDQATTFAITDTKRYVPVVTLSTDDNAKLLDQLKSGL